MIELKVASLFEFEKVLSGKSNKLFYTKSEADKVIAHQKYKRCLANAEACMHKRWRSDEGFDYARSTRHMKKWLEIAEKFKPNNSTDQ